MVQDEIDLLLVDPSAGSPSFSISTKSQKPGFSGAMPYLSIGTPTRLPHSVQLPS